MSTFIPTSNTVFEIEDATKTLHDSGKYEVTTAEVFREIEKRGNLPYTESTVKQAIRYVLREHPEILTEVGMRANARTFASTKFLETPSKENEVASKNRTNVVAVATVTDAPKVKPPRIDIYEKTSKLYTKEFAAVIGMDSADLLAQYHNGLEIQIQEMLLKIEGMANAWDTMSAQNKDIVKKLDGAREGYEKFAKFVRDHVDISGRLKLEDFVNDLVNKFNEFGNETAENSQKVDDRLDKINVWMREATESIETLSAGYKALANAPAPASSGTFESGFEKGFQAGMNFAIKKMGPGISIVSLD